jgi:hypothetical protein
MSVVYPLPPSVLPLQAAAQRLWQIRHLLREQSIDSQAALTSLGLLSRHPDPRIQSLAVATECDIADRAQHVGEFAR